MIKPIWKKHTDWEEYNNSMYVNRSDKNIISGCIEILTSEKLKSHMKQTTKDYKISTEVNFTNKMFNPISWIGQATCNLIIGATAQETCKAWLDMTKEQQNAANNIAKEVIKEWRLKYENIQ